MANKKIRSLNEQLKDSNKQLKKVDQMKSDFVSMVSHELRTPLAISKGGVGLLRDEISGNINEKQKEIVVMIDASIDRLLRIINNLLDVSKIEAGKTEMNLQLTDLNALVKKAVSAFDVASQKKAIPIVLKLPQKAILTHVDSDKITQVFVNLISNALKFTIKGHIDVTVKKMKNKILCSVIDTGIGLAKKDLGRIFGKFQQFAREYYPGEKGTGLGLSITKAIIELHGGTITVESELKKGTTFSFWLPEKQSQ